MKNSKTYLKLLIVVGLVAVVGGSAGTFASFNAETTNAGNTFATGTLLLSNDKDSDSLNLCYSNEASDNTNNCTALITSTVNKPDTSTSSFLTIKNEGTINASHLRLFIPQTQTGSTYCLTSNVGTLPGTDALDRSGELCDTLEISVEVDGTAGNSNTATDCVLGTPVGGAGADQNACNPSGGVTLDTLNGLANAVDLGAFNASDSTNYKIYIYLPDVGNTFQGRSALFDLTWRAEQ